MRTSPLKEMECPVARSAAEVGDAWRLLIIRDALAGFRRFEEFQSSLGIASNILSQRLDALVQDGYLERRLYQTRPERHEYVSTDKARDFAFVLAALVEFGTRWLSPDGATVRLVTKDTHHPIDLALVDRKTKRRVALNTLTFGAGPAAGPQVKGRVSILRAKAAKAKTQTHSAATSRPSNAREASA